VLAPLTNLAGECSYSKLNKAQRERKIPWHWNTEHQKGFNDIKAAITKIVALAYPDFSKEFEIYTDGSSHQISAIITQDNSPLASSAEN
jgi:hypothetical protein